jgi:hypothetical protein
MSCWVVPTIAAEIWGMPLEQLMQRINEGEFQTKLEQGFMFVDVAPDSPRYEPKLLLAKNAISERELAALAINDGADEDADEAFMPAEEPEAPANRGDWRTARRETGQLRVPPRSAAA